MGRIVLFISLLGLLAFSCTEEQCDRQTYPAMCLDDLGCANSAYTLIVATEKEFELIRSQEELENLVMGDCQVDIDWTIYDLVIGNLGLTNGLESISKSYRMNCSLQRLTLNIEVNTNLTLVAPRISWNALIPKLKDSETLFVNLDIKN